MTALEYQSARLDKAEERLEKVEDAQQELSAQLREALAAIKAGIWVVGGLWGISATLFGFWMALKR